MPTDFVLYECRLCPDGTYKSGAGDERSLCLPCQTLFTRSSASRIMCDCLEVLIDKAAVPVFNVNTGACDSYPLQDLVLRDASEWASNTSLTRYRQFPCEPGHYCVDGLRHKCPAGRFGVHEQETSPQCSGVCAAGYFCLQASTSAYSYDCGGAEWICAVGSVAPVRVSTGHYSNEDVPERLRSHETVCPVGYFCPGDGRRYPCAAGTYTDEEGTVSPTCKGVCDRGDALQVSTECLC